MESWERNTVLCSARMLSLEFWVGKSVVVNGCRQHIVNTVRVACAADLHKLSAISASSTVIPSFSAGEKQSHRLLPSTHTIVEVSTIIRYNAYTDVASKAYEAQYTSLIFILCSMGTQSKMQKRGRWRREVLAFPRVSSVLSLFPGQHRT